MQTADNPSSGPLVRLGLAVACGLVSFVLLFLYEAQRLRERAGGEAIVVLVAKTEIMAGDRINLENVDLKSIPQAYVHQEAVRSADQGKILNRRVVNKLKPDQPLLWMDLQTQDPGRLRVPLDKGLRVTSIAIGEQLAKSRFLAPGDFIDLLSHLNLGEKGSVTKTILQKIQVLELGQNAVVVALSAEQLEQVTFARTYGTLVVAVRNREDQQKLDLPPRTSLELPGNIPAYPK